MSETQHIMSCTKKGCTRCDPPPPIEKDKEVREEDDSYRIRTGFTRTRRN